MGEDTGMGGIATEISGFFCSRVHQQLRRIYLRQGRVPSVLAGLGTRVTSVGSWRTLLLIWIRGSVTLENRL